MEQIDNKKEGIIKIKSNINGAKNAIVETKPFDPLERRKITKIFDKVNMKEVDKTKIKVCPMFSFIPLKKSALKSF